MENELEMLRHEICAGFGKVNARIDGLRSEIGVAELTNRLHRETTERIEDSRRETDSRIEESRRQSQERIDALRRGTDSHLVVSADIHELRREVVQRIEALNERIDKLMTRTH